MNHNIEKNAYYLSLFQFYQNLLTLKQNNYFKNYFQENLSIYEIANIHHISSSAVSSALSEVTKKLNYLEEKLQLFAKYEKRNHVYQKYQLNKNLVKILQKIDEE